ncbi:MAG: hypothetical protein KDC86_10515, partial [Saprospiraceae bacterium]|nr:hypothetical protein [Saprospiraceae bacterium]
AERAQPDPDVYKRILARIEIREKLEVVKRPYVALAAACLAFLIMANVYAISNNRGVSRGGSSTYDMEIANYNLY